MEKIANWAGDLRSFNTGLSSNIDHHGVLVAQAHQTLGQGHYVFGQDLRSIKKNRYRLDGFLDVWHRSGQQNDDTVYLLTLKIEDDTYLYFFGEQDTAATLKAPENLAVELQKAITTSKAVFEQFKQEQAAKNTALAAIKRASGKS